MVCLCNGNLTCHSITKHQFNSIQLSCYKVVFALLEIYNLEGSLPFLAVILFAVGLGEEGVLRSF